MSKYFLLTIVLLLASCAPKNASAEPQPTPPTSVKTSLEAQDPTAAPLHEVEVGVVVVKTLNVREGPGINFPTVGMLNEDEKFYILGETVNSTNNKWLLISLSDNSFGWVTGDRSYVTVQKEMVDASTYSTWQKNVQAANSAVIIPVTSP